MCPWLFFFEGQSILLDGKGVIPETDAMQFSYVGPTQL